MDNTTGEHIARLLEKMDDIIEKLQSETMTSTERQIAAIQLEGYSKIVRHYTQLI